MMESPSVSNVWTVAVSVVGMSTTPCLPKMLGKAMSSTQSTVHCLTFYWYCKIIHASIHFIILSFFNESLNSDDRIGNPPHLDTVYRCPTLVHLPAAWLWHRVRSHTAEAPWKTSSLHQIGAGLFWHTVYNRLLALVLWFYSIIANKSWKGPLKVI